MNAATILVVEDDLPLREALCDTLQLAGFNTIAVGDGRAALQAVNDSNVAMVVSDIQMEPMDGYALLKSVKALRAEMPVLLMTAYGNIENAVAAMRDGAVDYIAKPFEAEVLVSTVNRYLPQSDCADTAMVAEDPLTRKLVSLAKKVAGSDASVLLSGESGTGKEVLARYIHQNSARAEQPFIAINCAAIPENMLEATLFGYEKGAFTGAYQSSPGKFEQAQKGTLLLDEISEMDLGLQAKLLRVLQEREVERLGGRKVIPLNVRVLATTNRNIHDEVAAGRFREDLFYRLNVFPLFLPPLRDRPRDIIPLAQHIVVRCAKAAARPTPAFLEDAKQRLLTHNWAGNVRELDNVLQRTVILLQGNEITAADICIESIEQHVCRGSVSAAAVDAVVDTLPAKEEGLNIDLKSREQGLIIEALKETLGSRKMAAERLGISQRTLRYKLARMRESGVAIPGTSPLHSV
ncbi:MAG: sigma-54-dependent Fis family transcriptional regulator [Gammaproteobacteria bacterium]|nr:sigma-54-dependent Fis family transcriptional regulator [Gammaproteobacteria bacterium]